MSKTREVWFPLTVIKSAPGPAMVRCLAICSSPVDSGMVPLKPFSKSTVSPAGVDAMASRREPAPALSRLVTVDKRQRLSSATSDGRYRHASGCLARRLWLEGNDLHFNPRRMMDKITMCLPHGDGLGKNLPTAR